MTKQIGTASMTPTAEERYEAEAATLIDFVFTAGRPGAWVTSIDSDTRARLIAAFAHSLRLAYEDGKRDGATWQLIYDEIEDSYSLPADTEVLLGWWEEWPVPRFRYEAGIHRSTKGGWAHSQATHWQPLPAPFARTQSEPSK